MLPDPADTFLVRYLLDEALRDRADADLPATLADEGVPPEAAAEILAGGEGLLRRIGAALRSTADPHRDPEAPGTRGDSEEPAEVTPPTIVGSPCSIYIRISPRTLDGKVRYLASLSSERPDTSHEPIGLPPEAGPCPCDDLVLHIEAMPSGPSWAVATRALDSVAPLADTRLHTTEGPEVEAAAREVLSAAPEARYDAITHLIRTMTR